MEVEIPTPVELNATEKEEVQFSSLRQEMQLAAPGREGVVLLTVQDNQSDMRRMQLFGQNAARSRNGRHSADANSLTVPYLAGDDYCHQLFGRVVYGLA